MYAAKIQIGYINQYYFGETPDEIMKEVEKDQDLDCLYGMGRMRGTKQDKKELDKLLILLDKYELGELTINDIKEINFNLSIGSFICHDFVEDDETARAIKKEYER